MKTSNKIFIIILSLAFISLYSFYAYYNNGITDTRNYFSFFQSIRDNGYISFMIESYLAAGKIEFIFYLIYSTLTLFPIFSDFIFFIFINHIILTIVSFIMINNISKYLDIKNHVKITVYSFFLYFTWLPSYLNIAWLWRADFAYALMLLGFLFYIRQSYFYFILFSFFAVFSHHSSLPILILLITLYSLSKNIIKFSFGVKFLFILFFAVILAFSYKFIKGNFTSGDGNWKSDYYLGNIIIIYLLYGFITITCIYQKIKSYINEKKSNFIKTTIYFSIFTLAIAMNSNGNHQDITRVIHVSVLLYCIVIPILYINSHYFGKLLLLLYVSLGCIPTIYIFFNFFILN